MSVLKILLNTQTCCLKLKLNLLKTTDELLKKLSPICLRPYHDTSGGIGCNSSRCASSNITMDASANGSKPEVFINPVILEKEGEISS